jgi:hypothetical protein
MAPATFAETLDSYKHMTARTLKLTVYILTLDQNNCLLNSLIFCLAEYDNVVDTVNHV